MKTSNSKRLAGLALLAAALVLALSYDRPAQAGGPIGVGGPTLGIDGQPFTWDTSSPIQYTTDGGTLGTLSNADALSRVAAMFQIWQDVPTANISYSRKGALQPVGTAFTDGDVSTVSEFNAVEGDSCGSPTPVNINPIIFDTDGSIFSGMGLPANVIGFASACRVNSSGRLVAGEAVMNGRFIDGQPNPTDLTDNEFNQAFTHEFGHFSGLDHSQINSNFVGNCPPPNQTVLDQLAGLPLMFPTLFQGCARLDNGLPPLADDDIAWISRLYPAASFNSQFGTITGTILFSDGVTPAQGVNVIARQVDDPLTPEDESLRHAVSSVSGYLFTGNPGQSVSCTNPGSTLTCSNVGGDSEGTRDPAKIGTFDIPIGPGNYTVEVESVRPGFTQGSSLRPLDPPIPNPGVNEFWNAAESATDDPTAKDPVTVTVGVTTANIDIILNGTPPRFDMFEGAAVALLWSPGGTWAWLRGAMASFFVVLQ